MEAVLLDGAVADVRRHTRYLYQQRPSAAQKFVKKLAADLRFLAENRDYGTAVEGLPARLNGLRKWRMSHFKSYLIYYRPSVDGIEVIRVIHGARDVLIILRKS